MGSYYTSHLIFGIEGTQYTELDTSIFDLKGKIESFVEKEGFSAILFDSGFKQGEYDEQYLSIFVGFEIATESDIRNCCDMDTLKQRMEAANKGVTRALILDMENHFPELNWGVIQLRNLVSVS